MRVYVFHKSFSTIQSHLLKEIPLAVELKVSIFRFWWTVRKKYVISLKNKTKKSGLWYFDTNDVLFLLKTKENPKGIWFTGLFYKYDFSSVQNDIKKHIQDFIITRVLIWAWTNLTWQSTITYIAFLSSDYFCLSPHFQDQQLEDWGCRNVIILQRQLFIDSFAFLLIASNWNTHSRPQFTRVWMEKPTNKTAPAWAFRTQEQIIHHWCSENTIIRRMAVLFILPRADAGTVSEMWVFFSPCHSNKEDLCLWPHLWSSIPQNFCHNFAQEASRELGKLQISEEKSNSRVFECELDSTH